MASNEPSNKLLDNQVAPSEEGQMSKKAAKKADKKAEKEAKKAERERQQQAAQAALEKKATDPETEVYGYLLPINSAWKTARKWTNVEELDDSKVGQSVWLRTRLQESRCKGSMGFLMLRQQMATVQAVLGTSLPKEIIKWTGAVPLESVVDVQGVVVKPEVDVTSTTQKVELQLSKFFVVSKAAPELPFQIKDASRPDDEEVEEGAITVGQDVRLDNRILDLRTMANQAVFRIQSEVCNLFRQFLMGLKFTEIHTPKLIGGASEGGANVFDLQYFGRPACLAQSPQLYKQMVLCGDMDKVFEIGPVFRAENSNTHRHLCEFTGLDMEMTLKEDYCEVLDVLDGLFAYVFEGLTTRCAREIAAVHKQHPAAPFVWLPKAPRLDFAEGVQMLRDAGVAGVPDDISEFDFSTEQEKALGRLVKERYNTDFYMLLRYPINVRPFYTMPAADDATLSNSYDFFMRGEEIVSGAQRIHDPGMLVDRAKHWKIPVDTIQSYIDSFKLGAYPHGGCGVGLERVVMLFLGLGNIRKASLFPRDPKRLKP